MTIARRDVLKGGAALAALSTITGGVGIIGAGGARAQQSSALFAPKPGAWRTFEITTALELPASAGPAQAWVPVPAFNGEGWTKPGQTTWKLDGGKASTARDAKSGASMVHVTWAEGAPRRAVEVTSRITARDRAVDIAKPGGAAPLSDGDRKLYTAATELLVLDGIVKETATKIVAGAGSELDKARRIYEWVVDNTFRNAKTRGCGVGDVASMLKTGDLSGKCADLNALYVGLARAAGLASRDIYGIRVAPSQFGYKSLGANSATITKAQHCRAEVFVTGIGWIPVDPADVRKVVLEEPPGNLKLDDAKVKAARAALFGAWETNWLAYNDCHDVVLPGSKGPSVPFLMYPQAETAAGRLDSLDPDAFKYQITAKEVAA